MTTNVGAAYRNGNLEIRLQWLMPEILATQEGGIRRTRVQSQPWANSSRDPIWKIAQKGLV
jgi:hypothetical protein